MPEDPTIPQRPPGERPESQRTVGGMPGFGAFGPGMGYPQIVANIGLFPSLFGLAFVSAFAPASEPLSCPRLLRVCLAMPAPSFSCQQQVWFLRGCDPVFHFLPFDVRLIRVLTSCNFGRQQQAPGLGPGVAGLGRGAQATEAAEAAQAAQAAMQQHEAAQQEFLSRLLFMIGTFIALCLIFFP